MDTDSHRGPQTWIHGIKFFLQAAEATDGPKEGGTTLSVLTLNVIPRRDSHLLPYGRLAFISPLILISHSAIGSLSLQQHKSLSTIGRGEKR